MRELFKDCVNAEVDMTMHYAIKKAFETEVNRKVDMRFHRGKIPTDPLLGKFAMCFKGGYISYYEEGMAFEEYCNALFTSKKYSTANNLFKKMVTITRKELKKQGVSVKDAKLCVLKRLLYDKWMGFRAEEDVKEFLEANGRKVRHSAKEEDEDYKLDLVVEDTSSGDVGIQVKSVFFLQIKEEHKQTNYIGQAKAIEEGLVNSVFYVFYDKDNNIADMVVRKKAFATREDCIHSKFISLDDMQSAYRITEEK